MDYILLKVIIQKAMEPTVDDTKDAVISQQQQGEVAVRTIEAEGSKKDDVLIEVVKLRALTDAQQKQIEFREKKNGEEHGRSFMSPRAVY